MWWSETAVRSHDVFLEAWGADEKTKQMHGDVCNSISNIKKNITEGEKDNIEIIYGAALTVQFQDETQTITMASSDLVDLAYESDSQGRWNPEGAMHTKQVTSKIESQKYQRQTSYSNFANQ